MSDCSRPEEKLKKFHILTLVASKPSLNPFIVNFLCQSTHLICALLLLEGPYGSGQESRHNYLLFPDDEDLSGADPFFLDSSVVCFI
jgi:hypothetical protein